MFDAAPLFVASACRQCIHMLHFIGGHYSVLDELDGVCPFDIANALG